MAAARILKRFLPAFGSLQNDQVFYVFRLVCTHEDVAKVGLGVADGSMDYEALLAWVRVRLLIVSFVLLVALRRYITYSPDGNGTSAGTPSK